MMYLFRDFMLTFAMMFLLFQALGKCWPHHRHKFNMSVSNGNCTFNNGGDLIAPYITWCYKSSTFCDLVLIASGNKRVPCHKLVMCSLSQRLLSICSGAEDMEDTIYIHLPQFTHQELKSVVDRIYGLLDQARVEIPRDEVTTVLGIENLSCIIKDGSKTHHIHLSGKSRMSEEENDSIGVGTLKNCDSEGWKIECDPDLVKLEQTLKDDEDTLNMKYELWSANDKSKEQSCDGDEEQAQGCLSLFHEY